MVSIFIQSFLIGSSPNLQGIQERLKTSDEFKCQPDWTIHLSSCQDLAVNEDRHKFSDEFEFWPDQTSNFGVICPYLLKKAIDDIVQSIVFSFFIGPLWNIQITWAGINSHKCSKFDQSWLFTLKLPALIAEKTIFDLLGVLDSGERSLPFWRLVFY